MTKVCLTTFVYGEDYQSYIPFLAYSCNKAYPQYDMQIFVYGNLIDKVKKQIESLDLKMNLIIHENSFDDFTKMTPLISRSLRWLLWHDSFTLYDYIYIVDIDILYIKENILLHEQHIAHMKLLNLPFSNIKRKFEYFPYKQPIYILQTIKHLGVKRAVKMMLKTKRIEYRLSGLHFVKVDEYYERLNSDVREKEIKILKRGKISNLIFYPNDEIYLYKLLDYVGFDLNRLATQSDGGIKMLEPTPNRLEFRPEHGIHLGMFRSKDIASFNLDILNSEAYQYYIQKYKEDIITDEVFINLLSIAPYFIKDCFQRLHNFCNLEIKI